MGSEMCIRDRLQDSWTQCVSSVGVRSEAPKGRRRDPQEPPQVAQETPKRPPKGPQTSPRDFQNAPKTTLKDKKSVFQKSMNVLARIEVFEVRRVILEVQNRPREAPRENKKQLQKISNNKRREEGQQERQKETRRGHSLHW